MWRELFGRLQIASKFYWWWSKNLTLRTGRGSFSVCAGYSILLRGCFYLPPRSWGTTCALQYTFHARPINRCTAFTYCQSARQSYSFLKQVACTVICMGVLSMITPFSLWMHEGKKVTLNVDCQFSEQEWVSEQGVCSHHSVTFKCPWKRHKAKWSMASNSKL